MEISVFDKVDAGVSPRARMSDFDAERVEVQVQQRFLLLALKGAGYLLLRLGEPAAALALFEKIAEIDTSDRLGVGELTRLARGAVTAAAAERLGGKVRALGR